MPLSRKRIVWPLAAGAVAMLFLSFVYLSIVSIAESPQHAIDLFWQDRAIVVPIILGFGIQAALYTILKQRLFLPVPNPGASGKLMGAGGTTSTLAMVACCAHHVTDVLPILGLTAAAAFLAQYRTTFMLIGLGINMLGIAVMSRMLLKERRRALKMLLPAAEAT